jgi:hypothetical protein
MSVDDRRTLRSSPVKEARADAFASLFRWPRYRGGVRLDGETYRHLSTIGLRAAMVEKAVDMLVKGGRTSVAVDKGSVVVRPTDKERASWPSS